MAGLGRIQQRFNAAVVAVLALAGFGRMAGTDAKKQARAGGGHPIHAKYLRTNDVAKATGRDSRPLPAFMHGTSPKGYRGRPGVNLIEALDAVDVAVRVARLREERRDVLRRVK